MKGAEPASALLPSMGSMALVMVPILVLSASTHLEPEQGFALAWASYMAAFLGWASLLWAWKSGKVSLSLRHVLLGAAVLRLVLLPSEPIFSDDIWRYVWDGRVQLAGVNPYQFAPADLALNAVRDGLWSRINHPEVPTIYPPVSQIVFAFSALFDAGLVPLRVVMSVCEFLALGAVWRLAALGGGAVSEGRKVWLALLVVWNPLMAVEFVGSGHLDALAIAPLCLLYTSDAADE